MGLFSATYPYTLGYESVSQSGFSMVWYRDAACRSWSLDRLSELINSDVFLWVRIMENRKRCSTTGYERVRKYRVVHKDTDSDTSSGELTSTSEQTNSDDENPEFPETDQHLDTEPIFNLISF